MTARTRNYLSLITLIWVGILYLIEKIVGTDNQEKGLIIAGEKIRLFGRNYLMYRSSKSGIRLMRF